MESLIPETKFIKETRKRKKLMSDFKQKLLKITPFFSKSKNKNIRLYQDKKNVRTRKDEDTLNK